MNLADQQTQPARIDEVVIDTNVLLDWLVFGDATVTSLARVMEVGRWRWIATPAMLAELDEVVTRLGRQSEHVLTSVARTCCRVTAPAYDPHRIRLHCCDPDDQMFVDLAVARRARHLFTRDKALLRLAPAAAPLGVQICRPADIAWPR